ncbi:MAG: DUF413 domain-containing protein [Cellvibrionales bacterium]|nr:DUF413 domain-containing protein [Cellvibrionales bacterium]
MENIHSCVSQRKFYGDQHFPYGLARSGEFTRQQVALLEDHGEAYQASSEGTREPTTEEENAFVSTCHAEKEPTTSHEIAWATYCNKITKKQQITSSPIGKANPSNPLYPREFNDSD